MPIDSSEAQEKFACRGHRWIHVVAQIAAWIWRWHDDRVGLRPMLGRYTAHGALVVIMLALLFLGNLRLDGIASASSEAISEQRVSFQMSLGASGLTDLSGRPYYRSNTKSHIVRKAKMHTAIPERPRLEIITYVVQPGDTTETIAEKFSLQPTTLQWSNPELEKAPDLLNVGQELTILPLDGVYHTVDISDTLSSLAETYKVSSKTIASCTFNTIPTSGELREGQKLIIPDGTKPYTPKKVTAYEGPVPEESNGSGYFRWPAYGTLTQGYWYGHRAIDIGSSEGAAIRAADKGYVSFAGWTDIGYGYLIVLDHANGYQSYYAHLSNIFIVEGQAVESTEVIGAMGNTGNSTGPHLHFEIRYNDYPTNPLVYLP